MVKPKILVVDDFYEKPLDHHLNILNKKEFDTQELVSKVSEILNQKVNVFAKFQESVKDEQKFNVNCNLKSDWIAVVYLTLPTICIGKQGLNFYIHKSTKLEEYPSNYFCEINGIKSIEDIICSFNVYDFNAWTEYSNVFLKYNRMVLFRSDLWHSYGSGFGDNLNNSLIYQKVLLKNEY
jgi:hypothetical protein